MIFLLDNILRTPITGLPQGMSFGIDSPLLGSIIVQNQNLYISGWCQLKGRMKKNYLSIKSDNNTKTIYITDIRNDINTTTLTGFNSKISFQGSDLSIGIKSFDKFNSISEFRFLNLHTYFSGKYTKQINEIQSSQDLLSKVNAITCAAAKNLAGKYEFTELKKSLIKFRQDYNSDLQEFLIKIINAYSEKFCLEFTAHGFNRTFRFWSHHEKTNYLKAASKTASILNNSGIPAFLSYGTILGLVRDGDLINHDDDIDLTAIISSELISKHGSPIKALEECLKSLNLNPSGDYKHHRHIKIDGHTMDIFCATESEKTVTMYCHKICTVAKTSIYPIESKNFSSYSDIDSFVPKEPNEFLKTYYGESWNIPILGFYF